MLIKDDRELLQKTAERALAFILDHCDETQLCNLTATLVQGMRELCDTEPMTESLPGQGVPVMDPRKIAFPPHRSKQYILNSLAEQVTPGATNAIK